MYCISKEEIRENIFDMAVRASSTPRGRIREDDDRYYRINAHEYDEEIDETEDDLIENYIYLTKHCGVLRHSPTTSVLDEIQRHEQTRRKPNPPMLPRQFTWSTEDHPCDTEDSCHLSNSHTSLNDFNNNYQKQDYSTRSRVPPTIYYHPDDDELGEGSFSLVKLFARMKARMKHDRRYRPREKHELLHEEDVQEWFELAKNVRSVLTKALLPDGGYDALVRQRKTSYGRRNSQRRCREYDPVLSKDTEEDEEKINLEIDDEMNTEGDEEFDKIIWDKFLKSSRGFKYRRYAVCKAIDRQQYQGQLVYVYGVANNILIDENLKASGLG